MTGNINVASSPVIEFRKIKRLSKQLGISINDIAMSAISVAMKNMFLKNGDQNSRIKIVIPANIRFSLYPTRDSIKIENKFAALAFTIPLCKSMESSYKAITKVSKKIKNSMGLIYSTYANSKLFYGILPRIIPLELLTALSTSITLAFSNIPGPIKPVYFYAENGEKVTGLWGQQHMIVAGKVGFGINVISFVNSFKITVTVDDGLVSK